jgi:hypothetical protein
LKHKLIGILAVGAALALGACSILHHGSSKGRTPAATPSAAVATQNDQNATNPQPSAAVNLSYGHPGDYLASMSVAKFSGAEALTSHNLDPTHTVSIIRFEGGAKIWEIRADTGLFSHLPMLNLRKKFAIKSVTYGKVPAHFIQMLPQGTPPEPLEPGRYYIFTAKRAFGPSSYEAVKVDEDGTLEGYLAEPRAGTSYALCCNVGPDFAVPVPPMDTGQ